MAAQTTNYRLNKPDRTDFVNIKEQLSDNLDIIDTEIKKAQDKADQAFQKGDNSVNKNGTTAMDNLTVGIRKSGSTIGTNSSAEGINNEASGNASHAEGIVTIASAEYSHAEGNATQATNSQTHAEGYHTTASGNASHAEGQYTNAAGTSSHAEGAYCYVLSGASYSHAEGTYTTALTEKMHVEGHLSTAGYAITYAITAFNDTAKTITLNNVTNLAVGDLLSIFRRDNSTKITLVDIPVSAIIGLVVTLTTTESLDSSCLYALKKVSSLGLSSHAEGTNTLASGGHSHAEGVQTVAISSAAHAEGNQTIASGSAAHAEGVATIASGAYSHAEGGYSVASGNYSHVAGYSTIAQGPYQAVFGRYNSYNTTDLFQIGSGTSDAARNNVFAITGDGSQLNQMNPLSTLTTQALIDAYYNNYSASMPIRTHYDTMVNHNFVHTTLGGGIYYLQGLKVDSLYEFQEITSYSDTSGFRRWGRSKFNGTWTSWKSYS